MVIIPVHSHQWGSQETHREWKQFGEEQARATTKRSDGGKEGQLEGMSLSLASGPNVFGLLTPVFPELELGQTLLHAVYPNPSFQIPRLCPSPNLMSGSTGHQSMRWTIAAALSMFG